MRSAHRIATATLVTVAALLAGPAGAGTLGLTGDDARVRLDRQPVEPDTARYLSQGIDVYETLFAGRVGQLDARHAALGRNRDRRAGIVRPPEIHPAAETGSSDERSPSGPTVSEGNTIDWRSFGVGAGSMAGLVAAALVGIVATRRRHTVGLP